MERNQTINNEKTEIYLTSKIISHEVHFEELVNGIWRSNKRIVCLIYRTNSKNQPLNLGECNNGDKFTAVNQAINQGKQYIDTCNKYNW